MSAVTSRPVPPTHSGCARIASTTAASRGPRLGEHAGAYGAWPARSAAARTAARRSRRPRSPRRARRPRLQSVAQLRRCSGCSGSQVGRGVPAVDDAGGEHRGVLARAVHARRGSASWPARTQARARRRVVRPVRRACCSAADVEPGAARGSRARRRGGTARRSATRPRARAARRRRSSPSVEHARRPAAACWPTAGTSASSASPTASATSRRRRAPPRDPRCTPRRTRTGRPRRAPAWPRRHRQGQSRSVLSSSSTDAAPSR